MNNLKLRHRILLGYSIPLLLFIVLGGFVFLTTIAKEKRQEAVENSQTNIVKADQLLLSLSNIVRNARGQVLFPDDDSYRKSYDTGVRSFEQVSSELRNRIQTPEQRARLDDLLGKANQVKERSDRVLNLVKAGNASQATATLSQVQLTEIEKIHEALLAQEFTSLTKNREEDQASSQLLRFVVVLGTAVAAIATFVLSWLISSSISKKFHHSANEVTIASSQISTTVEQQGRIASQQAASVNETTTTMDELEASCRQSAEQAQAALAAARQALQFTETGTQAVGKTLEGMFVMEKKVEAIAEQIVQLSEQVDQIGLISQLVSEFANQTNMLALNSSVEAVRAGEHGKGFAIVANEIRKLSDQSQISAEKISVLVGEIQKAINATVMVTDEGTKTVKTGVQTAQDTEETFTGVEDAVNKVVLNNQQVSLNLKQQVDAIRQVVEAMESINHGAKETSVGLTEISTGTKQLNQLASDLKEIMS